jgi:hypothetical protein
MAIDRYSRVHAFLIIILRICTELVVYRHKIISIAKIFTHPLHFLPVDLTIQRKLPFHSLWKPIFYILYHPQLFILSVVFHLITHSFSGSLANEDKIQIVQNWQYCDGRDKDQNWPKYPKEQRETQIKNPVPHSVENGALLKQFRHIICGY